jgi:uncharacterized protein YjbJ (UPF0337 family)
MKATKERLKGKAEENGGAVQKNVGKAVGNPRMETEGTAHQAKGIARQETVKAAERTKGSVEGIAGRVKETAGKLFDDPELELEGKGERLQGKVRRKTNQ